jgi:hypothetical protein
MNQSRTSFRLEEAKGKQPILLLFAPSDRSPAYENQVVLLEEESNLETAGVLVARIFSEGDSYLDGTKLEPSSVEQIRSQFQIDDDTFLIVLIGRDGSEKQRDDAPLQPAVILERISDARQTND